MPDEDAIILAALEVYLSYCARAVSSAESPEELAQWQGLYNETRAVLDRRRGR